LPRDPSSIRVDERLAEQVADAMFALSTPSRVHILASLLAGPHSVKELVEMLGMEQSAVSHQLRVLRDHDLVTVERIGRQRVYALVDEHVSALVEEAFHHVEHRAALRVGLRRPPRTAERGLS
jgi:DNA-binding transcriptional ArsR family regulator